MAGSVQTTQEFCPVCAEYTAHTVTWDSEEPSTYWLQCHKCCGGQRMLTCVAPIVTIHGSLTYCHTVPPDIARSLRKIREVTHA